MKVAGTSPSFAGSITLASMKDMLLTNDKPRITEGGPMVMYAGCPQPTEFLHAYRYTVSFPEASPWNIDERGRRTSMGLAVVNSPGRQV